MDLNVAEVLIGYQEEILTIECVVEGEAHSDETTHGGIEMFHKIRCSPGIFWRSDHMGKTEYNIERVESLYDGVKAV
jgi:hypothetical protein